MPQSLANVTLHLIFSTKNRKAVIPASVRDELIPYLAAVLKSLDCPAIRIAAQPDHLHILFHLSRNTAIGEVVEELKNALQNG